MSAMWADKDRSTLWRLAWLYRATGAVAGGWKTVTGKIASFVAPAAAPLKALSVEIRARQNLKGYDRAWIGGMGDNLLPPYGKASETKGTITLTNSNGQYTVNANFGSASFEIETNIPAGTYTISAFNSFGTSGNAIILLDESRAEIDRLNLTAANAVRTFTAGTKIAFVRLNFANRLMNAKLSPVIAAGDQAPEAFTPYENICGISGGWSEATVYLTGTNLWNEQWRNGYLDASGNTVEDAGSIMTDGDIPVNPGMSFYVKTPEGLTARLCAYDVSGALVSSSAVGNAVYTVPDGAYVLRFGVQGYGAAYQNDISLNAPISDTDYHPHTGGGNYQEQFPGGEKYGGTLDVLNGKLTVDKTFILLGTQEMTEFDGVPGWSHPQIRIEFGEGVKQTFTNQMMNVGSVFAVDTTGDNSILTLPGYGLTPEEWYSKLQAVQIVLPKGEPEEISVTPWEAETLAGQNNIWSNAGNVKVTYSKETT